MSDRRKNRKRAGTTPFQAPPKIRTADSFQNFLTMTGINTGNIAGAGGYGFNPISRNRLQVEYAYRGSWIVGAAVDCIAEDMTRSGVEIQSSDKPDRIEKLHREARRIQVWHGLSDAIKWARLYGGSLALLWIDGQKPDQPLRLDTVSKGQFKGIFPIDRWALIPSLQDLISEPGPKFGQPRFYTVVPDMMGMPSMKLHHSRVIRLDGVRLPYWQRITENLWGQSVIERLWDRLIAFDSATSGSAQMIFRAYLRTYKIEGLRDAISAGGDSMKGIAAQIDMIRQYQMNEGLTLMDSKDEFDTHQYAFSGLSEMIQEFAQQVSGALQIPMVRLLGQSPAGFSDGDSDLRSYYDGIAREQESQLREGVELIYTLLYISLFGSAPPDSFTIEFRPLWQMDEQQRANITTGITTSVTQAYEANIIDRATAMKELRQTSRTTNLFTNITDEMIQDAEADPAPSPEVLGLVATDNPKTAQSESSGGRIRARPEGDS